MMQLTLPSRIESVDEAAMLADEFARRNGCGDDVLSAVDLAVRESVANAVKHGNKYDESKDVQFSIQCSEDCLEITVRDFGSGFAVTDVPDPTDPENLLKVNGRGILFMRSFMDEIEWFNPPDGGMQVKMVKKR
jgi:serine/threonine-protein kinase RsbW